MNLLDRARRSQGSDLLRQPRIEIEAAALVAACSENTDTAVEIEDERITAAAAALMPGIPMTDARAIKTVNAELAKKKNELDLVERQTLALPLTEHFKQIVKRGPGQLPIAAVHGANYRVDRNPSAVPQKNAVAAITNAYQQHAVCIDPEKRQSGYPSSLSRNASPIAAASLR